MVIVLVAFSAIFFAVRPHQQSARAVIRAQQLARLRFVAGRLTQYANDYKRPAFRFDSVAAHLDSAGAAEFRSYLTDLWGDSIGYYWTYTTFTLWSNAGLTDAGREAAIDSAMRQRDRARSSNPSTDTRLNAKPGSRELEVLQELDIRESFGWPVVARGDSVRLRREQGPENRQRVHR